MGRQQQAGILLDGRSSLPEGGGQLSVQRHNKNNKLRGLLDFSEDKPGVDIFVLSSPARVPILQVFAIKHTQQLRNFISNVRFEF